MAWILTHTAIWLNVVRDIQPFSYIETCFYFWIKYFHLLFYPNWHKTIHVAENYTIGWFLNQSLFHICLLCSVILILFASQTCSQMFSRVHLWIFPHIWVIIPSLCPSGLSVCKLLCNRFMNRFLKDTFQNKKTNTRIKYWWKALAIMEGMSRSVFFYL